MSALDEPAKKPHNHWLPSLTSLLPLACQETTQLLATLPTLPAALSLSINCTNTGYPTSPPFFLTDPLNEDSIIAIIKFTPFNKFTPSEKDDLNFISTFLHHSKWFISKVSSCPQVLGGFMWAIGGCKSYGKDQMFGWYIKQFGPEDQIAFNYH
ncbi:hypothetical protein VP01_1427g5 [Puccinia sorghi]|uniref:Uncharacterized protein n=1 Tax=Puccinia sorghi TaxID=27349 RepID=A0A0L6VL28_9BASI|nr:hypothetical protein VP01_1427g5 [Puccinia sorghi]